MFTKSDLQDWDWVVLRNGYIFRYMESKQILVSDTEWLGTKDYNDEMIDITDNRYSIMQVYRPEEKWHYVGSNYKKSTLVFDRSALPTKFTFEDFKAGKFAVNCINEHDAAVFLAYLHGKGLQWCDGVSLTSTTNFRQYRQNSCYRLWVGVACGCKSGYDKLNIPVIPFNKADLD